MTTRYPSRDRSSARADDAARRRASRRSRKADKGGATPSFFGAMGRSLTGFMDSKPGLDYLMIRMIVATLVGIGLVMAVSSSMASSIGISGEGTWWTESLRQFQRVALGAVFFVVVLHLPLRFFEKGTGLITIATVALLVLVHTPLGTGREEVGSQSWLLIGPLQFQPSESAKIAIALWGAYTLTQERVRIGKLELGPLVAFALGAAPMIGLVFAEGDLGMALVLLISTVAAWFFSGLTMLWVWPLIIVGAVGGIFTVFLGGGYRSERLVVYLEALTGKFDDIRGSAFQAHQGMISVAEGSLWGVGLGQSRAKWFYLPEAKNDFIFAIVGEELGFWGGALVIFLFVALGFFGLRTAVRARNQFQAVLAGTLTAGIVAQALYNMGYVIGLFPVTGIQLPLISSGGTSAIITLAAMGILASIARNEPEYVSVMQSGEVSLFDRIFKIRVPQPRDDGGRPLRRPAPPRRREERYGAPITRRVTVDTVRGRSYEDEILGDGDRRLKDERASRYGGASQAHRMNHQRRRERR